MTMTLELADRSGTASDVARPILPILIQVPNLAVPARRPVPRRRRLRKEVRVAGLTMMSVLPVGFLLLALGGAQPVDRPLRAAVPRESAGHRREAEAPRVATTLDPTTSTEAWTPAPVEFRDYLLPVDGPEEPEHAGR